MNIKFLLLAVVVVFAYFQFKEDTSDLGTLNKVLDTYTELELSEDYGKEADYIYPKIYIDKLSKEQLRVKLNKKAEKTRDITTITGFQFIPRLPLKTYADGLYALVDYTKSMTIDFSSKLPKDADEEAIKKFKRGIRLSLSLMRMSAKEGDKMELDEVSNIVSVKKSGTFILINENKHGWKFIDTTLPKTLLKKILHTDIINQEQEFIIQLEDAPFYGLTRQK